MPTKQIAEELAGFMDPLPATSAPAAAPATPGAPVAASSPYDERMRVTEYVEGGAKEGILGVTRALLEHVCAERPPSTTDLRLRVLELFRFAYSPRGVAASGKPASKAVTAPRISEPLCPTALLFVAELCWQEHLAAATSSTTTSESQLCKSILSEMSFRGSERLHEDWRESLMARARESWLRAHLAESEAALAASESHLHRCELLIQELGGALRVDCAGDTPITSRSIAAKRAGLQARRALEQTGNLMQLGKFAECAEALAPFLSSGTESKKMRGPVTLNRALEAALRSDRFDVALACQEYRLQTALSSSGKLKRTKLSYNPEWAANCSSPESAPPTRRTLMQQEVAVLALILRNLSDPPRSFEETLGPRLQRLVLECLERLSGGQLEDAAAQCAAVQCWECFLRVWAMLNEPQEQTMLPLASLALNICVQKGIHRADDGLAIRFCVQALHYSGAAAPAQPAAIMLDDTAETADFSSAASWREFAGTVLFHLYGVRLSSLSQLKRSKSDLDGQVGLTQHEGLLWLKWAQPQLIPSQMTNFEQAQWAAFVTRLWSLFNAPPSTIAKYADIVSSILNSTGPLPTDLSAQVQRASSAARPDPFAAVLVQRAAGGHELGFLYADLRHRLLMTSASEQDQVSRRTEAWLSRREAELQQLCHCYQLDASVNISRYDTWLYMGECHLWRLDNHLDRIALGYATVENQVSLAELYSKARNCFAYALSVQEKAESWDQLAFLAYAGVRQGFADADKGKEAFKRAQTLDPAEWMYPYMQGKLHEHCEGRSSPSVFLAYYAQALRLHSDNAELNTDEAVELHYRLHASRLKAALRAPRDMAAADWEPLLANSFVVRSSSAPLDPLQAVDPSAQFTCEQQRQVVTNATAAMHDCRRPTRDAGKKEKKAAFFFKSVYAVAWMYLCVGCPGRSADELETLLSMDKPKAKNFWRMWNYPYADFGDFVYASEQRFDKWRAKVTFLYLLAVALSGQTQRAFRLLLALRDRLGSIILKPDKHAVDPSARLIADMVRCSCAVTLALSPERDDDQATSTDRKGDPESLAASSAGTGSNPDDMAVEPIAGAEAASGPATDDVAAPLSAQDSAESCTRLSAQQFSELRGVVAELPKHCRGLVLSGAANGVRATSFFSLDTVTAPLVDNEPKRRLLQWIAEHGVDIDEFDAPPAVAASDEPSAAVQRAGQAASGDGSQSGDAAASAIVIDDLEPTAAPVNAAAARPDKPSAPRGWGVEFDTNTGKYYYWNKSTHERSWARPQTQAEAQKKARQLAEQLKKRKRDAQQAVATAAVPAAVSLTATFAEAGSLGLTLKERDGHTYVSAVAPDGQGSRLGIQPLMVLRAVNAASLDGLTLKRIVAEHLKPAGRPLVMLLSSG